MADTPSILYVIVSHAFRTNVLYMHRYFYIFKLCVSCTGTGANVDLIWCHDFRAALAERQQARKCEAEIRASYVVSDVEEATLVPSDEPVGDAGTES